MTTTNAPISVSCPGSKSMTQRALIIAALADGDGQVTIDGALECDDSRYLSQVLRALGVDVQWDGSRVQIQPSPLASSGERQFVGNAGTAMRFSSSLSLLTEGELVLDGDDRMRQRPLGPLTEALQRLGVQVRYLGQRGYPPVSLRRGGALRDEVDLDVSQSSQFASALLLVAPRLPRGLVVRLSGERVSVPYLDMTTKMMERAGVRAEWESSTRISVPPGRYDTRHIVVEPDWSTAAFLLGAGVITGQEVDLPGLSKPGESLQGDAAFMDHLRVLRQPVRARIDLRDTPDLIAPLAAVALFAADPTEIRGVAHARVKECDRLAVLANELTKVGARVQEHTDGLTIHPLDTPTNERVELDPSNDHRMAMAFALVGLRVPGIVVRNPECVSKSFPRFWEELERFQKVEDPS